MPTYAYSCTTCQHYFEAVQSFSEDSLTICPVCEGSLRKQYGSIGVTFNGSGFYRTDARTKENSQKNSSAENSAAPKNKESSNTGTSSSSSTKVS